jgi:hypothetical protein
MEETTKRSGIGQILYKAVHFIGFPKDNPDLWWKATLIWGHPDFVHEVWDVRAKLEVMAGDTAVFARGTDSDEPSFYPVENESYLAYARGRADGILDKIQSGKRRK